MRAPRAREAASSQPADLRRRLRFAFAALGVLVLAIVVAAIVIAKDIHDSAQGTYLREVIPLRTAARDVELQLLNEETGVRGFVITGRRTSLEPYDSGSKAAAADLALLRARAVHDATLAQLVRPVLRLHAQLDVFFRDEVRLAGTGPSGRARAAARVETGKARASFVCQRGP